MASSGLLHLEAFAGTALEVYLLPRTPWEEVLALQQRLVYEISGEPRDRAALILCEHPPIITVGRHGSREHIRVDEEDLQSRRVEIRWTNRGGGCWLQLPGQLAAYPIVPLDPQGFGLDRYRASLYRTLCDVLDEFHLPATCDGQVPGLNVAGREIAAVGVAVKNWVAYHGCCLNVCVPMHLLDWIQSSSRADRKATCMFRELRSPIRTTTVRESFARHFARVFGFADSYLFHAPPVYFAQQRVANVATGNP